MSTKQDVTDLLKLAMAATALHPENQGVEEAGVLIGRIRQHTMNAQKYYNEGNLGEAYDEIHGVLEDALVVMIHLGA